MPLARGAVPSRRCDPNVLHELRHLARLAHVADATQLMNPTTTASPTGYADGDRHGPALLGRGACS